MIKFKFDGKEFEYDQETNMITEETGYMKTILETPGLHSRFLREIRKNRPKPEKLKLNIGCGYRPFMDYVNLDYDPIVCPDVVRNVDEGLPFDSDKFDEIYSSHVIEHVKDVFLFVYEIWRVSKNGAKIIIIAPYAGFLEWAIQPDHLRFMNWGFFDRWKPERISVQNELKQTRGAYFNIKHIELFNEGKEIKYELEVVKNE